VKKLLVLLLLLAACVVAGAWWFNSSGPAPMTEATFTFASVERGELVDSVSGTGILHPREIILVASEQPGVVVEVLAGVNDTVTEGAVLARLDPRRLQLKDKEAEDGVETARAFLLQAQSLEAAARLALKYQVDIEEKGGFRSERDQAKVKLEAAQAGVVMAKSKLAAAQTAVRQAELALKQAEIRVPGRSNSLARSESSGKRKFLILERKVESGQMVGQPTPSAPLFTLAEDLGRMEVHTEVAQGDIDRVRVGLPASFTISSATEPERRFPGTVRQIRPLPASVKGAVFYNVVLEVANQRNEQTGEWWLRPGMDAAVDIVLRRQANAWKVPTAALSFQLEDAYQTRAARNRLAQWQTRPDHSDWKPIWIWDEERACPWPVFVRIADRKAGRFGIKDGDHNEVLEWEPGREPRPGTEALRVITNAPPAHAPGFFDQPANIKVS
jgi:HlyD family secretion protein